MLFNKLKFILVFAVLLVVGFAFVVTPATVNAVPQDVEPVLLIPDEVETVEGEPDTEGIQRYGIRAEPVSVPLTITFQDPNANPPKNTPVTGFDVNDIVLQALDSKGDAVLNGATVASPTSTDNAVWTTTITVKGNVSKVNIAVPAYSVQTLPIFSGGFQPGASVPSQPVTESVNIIRSAAPPLTLSPDRSIGGNAPFTVTLTATTPITLTEADIKVTGGFIPTNGITSDAAKKVWTVTITPGVGITQITVEPATNGAYIFRKGAFTVDTAGPIATITPTPIGNGVYSITIAFNEPLQTGATLMASEISVIGASIGVLSPIATDSYVATLIRNNGATEITVQINAGAVTDAGGTPNAATPSPALSFRVAAGATPPGTALGRGNVTISEIMFANDGGASDLQWIELFNSSKTETVALDAGSGWKLIIENYDDRRSNEDPLSGTINFKEHGRVKRIAPRQTVLIVSANGRNSRTAHAKGQLFVPTRVFEVHSELAREFGMRTARDPFLHATKGFHIELADGSNRLVDEVGNLDGRARTADEPAWELPNGWTEDRDRTSIIRRYDRDRARNGTLQEAWISAANTSFLDLSEKRIQTWYGIRTDHGSPGIRAGGALPVQLSHFRPDLTDTGAVVINWTTESEVDNAGFNILRSETRTGEFKVINAQLIPGAGTTAERNTYTWTDTTAKPNVVYYYQIEDVSLDGDRQTLATVRLRGFVSATGKLTTQWGQLKRLRD